MTTNFVGKAVALGDDGLQAALDLLGVTAPAFCAVLQVETSGCGFLASRKPKILFERHVFSRLTDHQFDRDAPDVSNKAPGGYGQGGDAQYARLHKAMALAHDEALMSASWGLGQLMGEHAKDLGFADVDEMVSAMCESEAAQVAAMAKFIDGKGLAKALGTRNWPRFAEGYNGSNYQINHYDTRLASSFEALSRGALPNLRVRAAQVYLTFLGFDPHGVDGVMGRMSRAAMNEFQGSKGLPATDVLDDAILRALRDAIDRLV